MINWHFGKRNWFLVVAIAIVTIIVLAYAVDQEVISEHMYPRDAIHEDSNLWVRGTVTSIEENHKSQGLAISSYHIFRYYIQLNITEIAWINNDLADWIVFSTENNTINNRNSISIGYDNFNDLQLVIGQTVECRGYYLPVTDTPYSFIITVAPSINESYMIHGAVAYEPMITLEEAIAIGREFLDSRNYTTGQVLSNDLTVLEPNDYWHSMFGIPNDAQPGFQHCWRIMFEKACCPSHYYELFVNSETGEVIGGSQCK